MNLQLGVLRMVMAVMILVAISACAPSPIPETVTAVPFVPAATDMVTAAATTTPVHTPQPTATMAQPTATIPPTAVPEESAQYLLTFEATWSVETHPTDFPPNPHFSGLIGMTHSEGVSLWEEGGVATAGMKNMAETGGKSPLDSEIEALIVEGEACELISGGGIALSPGEVTVESMVNQDCPLVTVVSMIAPSPDWFVGVTRLNLYGDGGWVEELVVELYPYDAGTDSGGSYTSPDEPTGEGAGIHRLEVGPLLVEGQVAPLGVFRFSRLRE